MFACPFARTCCRWGTTHARTLPIVAVWHGPSAARLCYHQCVSLRPLPIQHLAQPSCTAIQGEGNAAVHSRFVKSRKAICFTPSCLVQAPCGPDSRGVVHPMPVCATFEYIILPCVCSPTALSCIIAFPPSSLLHAAKLPDVATLCREHAECYFDIAEGGRHAACGDAIILGFIECQCISSLARRCIMCHAYA